MINKIISIFMIDKIVKKRIISKLSEGSLSKVKIPSYLENDEDILNSIADKIKNYKGLPLNIQHNLYLHLNFNDDLKKYSEPIQVEFFKHCSEDILYDWLKEKKYISLFKEVDIVKQKTVIRKLFNDGRIDVLLINPPANSELLKHADPNIRNALILIDGNNLESIGDFDKISAIETILKSKNAMNWILSPNSTNTIIKMEYSSVEKFFMNLEENLQQDLINNVLDPRIIDCAIKKNLDISSDSMDRYVSSFKYDRDKLYYVFNYLIEHDYGDKTNEFASKLIFAIPDNEPSHIPTMFQSLALPVLNISQMQYFFRDENYGINIDAYMNYFDGIYGKEGTERIRCLYENILKRTNRIQKGDYSDFSEGFTNDFYLQGFVRKFERSLNRYIKLFLDESEFIKKTDQDNLIKYIYGDLFLKEKICHEQMLGSNSMLRVENRLSSNPINKDEFISLIESAYGTESAAFLKKRVGLCNFDNIDHIELLDFKVLSSFRDGFIQDLFSYNFPSINKFLETIKDVNDFELFKKHYQNMTKVFGENCESMEKAFQHFYDFKALLIDMEKKQLDDKDYSNLVGMYCANAPCGIKKVEEISSFPLKYLDKIIVMSTGDFRDRDNIIGEITNTTIAKRRLYGLAGLEKINLEKLNSLDENDKKTVQVIRELCTNSKILPVLQNLVDEGKLSPFMYSCISVVDKIKLEMLQEYEKGLLNAEKIEHAIANHEDGVSECEIQGCKVVFLGDLKYDTAIMHNVICNMSMSRNVDANACANFDVHVNPTSSFKTYDGYDGLSTISCRHGQINYSPISEQYIFWDISQKDIVAYQSQDAGVYHTPKLLKSGSPYIYGDGDRTIGTASQTGANEIAFYRRERDHEKIEESITPDGKILPDAIVISSVNRKETFVRVLTNFGTDVMILVPGYETEEKKEQLENTIIAAKKIKIENEEKEKQDDISFNESNDNNFGR